MAEPWLGVVEKITEFFATAQIEAYARRTGFVRRTSKITGKVFLALVTLGAWSTRKTSLGQLAAKAAQLPTPVDVSPEALHQRMTQRAVAVLRELLQQAFLPTSIGERQSGMQSSLPRSPLSILRTVRALRCLLPSKSSAPVVAGERVAPELRFNSCGSISATASRIWRWWRARPRTTDILTRWCNSPTGGRCFS